MERTLILIKPDAITRGQAGNIISRFEQKGLKIIGIKMIQLTDTILHEHYSHLTDKPFFPTIYKFMSQQPIIAICLEGLNVIEVCRKMCGITNSCKAEPGTIRGDLGMSVQANLIHSSDSKKNAAIEIKRFFHDKELFDYTSPLSTYCLTSDEY